MMTPTTGDSVLMLFCRSCEYRPAEAVKRPLRTAYRSQPIFQSNRGRSAKRSRVCRCREFGKRLKNVTGRSTMSERGVDSAVPASRPPDSLDRRDFMCARIGERHASACRYKGNVPEGSRRSARRIHFGPHEVQDQFNSTGHIQAGSLQHEIRHCRQQRDGF